MNNQIDLTNQLARSAEAYQTPTDPKTDATGFESAKNLNWVVFGLQMPPKKINPLAFATANLMALI